MDKWKTRYKVAQGNRLIWYRPKTEEYYWDTYFPENVTEDYYKRYERNGAIKGLLNFMQMYLPKRGRIVEAGCGVGIWVYLLRKRGYDVYGIEKSADLVERAKKIIPDLPIKCGDALNIGANSEFNGYLSFGVMEHLQEGPEPFLKEAYCVLKPGGIAIISIPHYGPVRRFKALLGLYPKSLKEGEKLLDDYEFHQYGFTMSEFKKICKGLGFSCMDHRHFGFHRLLMEELSLYRRMMRLRGSRYIKKLVNMFFEGKDGHMIYFVMKKT